MIESKLHDAELTNIRVLLRADLDVPVKDNQIMNDFRLTAIEATLKLLIQKGARIILATHRGRPKGIDPALSTTILLPWFKERGYPIRHVASLEEAYTHSQNLENGAILLLENLRFNQKEHNNPGTSCAEQFAQDLAKLADYYVNDAFALLHRLDTSITLVPALFAPENKSIGLLIEREMKALSPLLQPKRPFFAIVGGGKVHDKLPYIEKLLERADKIIVLPAIAYTFLKAQGMAVGQSLVDENAIPLAGRIIETAKQRRIPLILPVDHLISMPTLRYGEEGGRTPPTVFTDNLKTKLVMSEEISGNKEGQTPPSVVLDKERLIFSEEIPANGVGISVGPKSLELYAQELAAAQTIFFNGAMGLFERPETMEPMKELLQTIAQMNALSIIGGGESVAAVYLNNLQDHISFCSTGGGASLYYVCYGHFPSLIQAGLF